MLSESIPDASRRRLCIRGVGNILFFARPRLSAADVYYREERTTHGQTLFVFCACL